MDPATSAGTAHVGSTLIAVGAMQWLKKASWFPLLKDGQRVLNRTVSVFVALGIQAGISYTYTSTANGGHSITLLLPSYYAMAVGLFHWASQYLYQETGYTFLTGLQAFQEGAGKLSGILAHMQDVTDTRRDAVKVEPVVP